MMEQFDSMRVPAHFLPYGGTSTLFYMMEQFHSIMVRAHFFYLMEVLTPEYARTGKDGKV